MKRLLIRGILAMGAVGVLSLAGTTARANTFTLNGINTGVTGTVNITQLSNNLVTVTVTNTSTGGVHGKITSIGSTCPAPRAVLSR